jgi:hypothetical protein
MKRALALLFGAETRRAAHAAHLPAPLGARLHARRTIIIEWGGGELENLWGREGGEKFTLFTVFLSNIIEKLFLAVFKSFINYSYFILLFIFSSKS